MDECDRVSANSGYCGMHFRRFQRHGDPLTLVTERNGLTCKIDGCSTKPVAKNLCNKHWKAEKSKTRKKCSVSECKNIEKARGLCETHYNKERSRNKPLCIVEECTKNQNVKQMCNQHYLMWKKYGDPLAGAYRMPFKKAIDHGDGTRTCTRCMERLPNSSFHKDKAAPDGLRAACKKCRIAHVKEWYQDNRERQSGKEKKRRLANVEKYVEKEALRYLKDREKRIALATEHSHRRKARKLKTVIEKGITKKALKKKFGTKCYYCKKEMDFSVGVGRKFNKDMATIEHLVPLARGGEHTWENTVLACRHCNISKNAKTIEEFDEFNKS